MEVSATKIMDKFQGLELDVVPISNKFFGETITVSGLVTAGGDLISQLKGVENVDGIIIPKSMLRKDTDIFLDDLSIKDVEEKLNTEVIPMEVLGKDFINLFRNVQVI